MTGERRLLPFIEGKSTYVRSCSSRVVGVFASATGRYNTSIFPESATADMADAELTDLVTLGKVCDNSPSVRA